MTGDWWVIKISKQRTLSICEKERVGEYQVVFEIFRCYLRQPLQIDIGKHY